MSTISASGLTTSINRLAVYLHHIDFPVSEHAMLALTKKASPKRLERAQRYRFHEDKVRCLMAEDLLKHALKTQGLANYDEICQNICLNDIGLNNSGKPVFDNQSLGHFNLSHSGEWVVCALDNQTVGIDVERFRKPLDAHEPKDLKVMKLFSEAEQAYINKADISDRPARFYRLWTLKESYLKALGVGLSQPLNSFTINIIDEHHANLIIDEQIQTGWYFYYFNVDANHVFAICAKQPINAHDFEFR